MSIPPPNSTQEEIKIDKSSKPALRPSRPKLWPKKKMRIFYRVALKVCPTAALLYSLIVTVTTMYINEGISPPLIFISVQVYLNWYCIYSISKNATTMRSTERSDNSIAIPISDEQNSQNSQNFQTSQNSQNFQTSQNSQNSQNSQTSQNSQNSQNFQISQNSQKKSSGRFKYWYCDKCCCYTYRPTQHCGACKKCFHFRDHHCFFVGACVIRQNMGNFILICFYTSLACLYSLTTIGPHLYANLSTENGTLATILSFCFPVALARFLIAGEDANLPLVTLFDSLFSVCCLCFMYGAWKFYYCLSGRQRYYPHIARRQDTKEIFGSYGLANLVFPYNGFLGTRDIDGSYELKEV